MRGSSRRFAGVSVATGLAAVAALVVAVHPTETGTADDSGEGWLAGLLLVFGPTLGAAVTLSVTSSRLLRRVGIPATVAAALAAIVHVGVLVDERGGAGWLLAVPAVLTIVLLVASLVAGPTSLETSSPEPSAPPPPEPLTVDGPPLDVLGALHDARSHAGSEVVAWVIVLIVTAVLTPVALLALGWPRVVETLDARVVSIDTSEVTFAAEHDGGTLTWSYERSEDSRWEVGERRRVHLDEDGRVHLDAQFGLVGVPLVFAPLFVVLFLGFALRRLWGVVIATFDAGRGVDRPRHGYVALVRPYRSWRPLAAVWWRDPTRGERLARADAVYRADEEAADEMHADASEVVVHRAWVDTGFKPRWIAADRGVVIPHRRALVGRWHVRILTNRATIADVVELHHAAPVPPVPSSFDRRDRRDRPHRLAPMVAWRTLAIPVSIAIPFLAGPGGETVRQLR